MRRSDFINRMIPISALNQGKATKVLNSVTSEHEALIMKNNKLKAVIISPEQYQSYCALAEECATLLTAESISIQSAARIQALLKKTRLYADD